MYYQALVNKKHKYREEMYQNRVLITIENIHHQEIKIEEKTYQSFCRLKEFVEKEQQEELGISSAYQSIVDQPTTPSCSEHRTGLALDIVLKIEDEFKEDEETIRKNKSRYEKLVPHLAQFGFILRYPKGFEKITGFEESLTHIRYVGKKLATTLAQNNWTLEQYYENLSGVIVVAKEKNMTSRDVVNLVGKYFYTKKVGHTGTLDPLATGVLVVTLGKATRIGELLTASNKEYRAKVQVGVETDTLDITGKIKKKQPIKTPIPNLKQVLTTFQKTYFQEVPLYSATKVNGKKLYEYARNNEEVDLPKKEVTIKKIELEEEKEDTFTFKAVVSKGCYIRSLIRDIGKTLKIPLTMKELVRTKQGSFSYEEAVTLEEIKEGKVTPLSIATALKNMKQQKISTEDYEKVFHGQSLNIKAKEPCVILNQEGETLAIYRPKEGKLVPWKVLKNTNTP